MADRPLLRARAVGLYRAAWTPSIDPPQPRLLDASPRPARARDPFQGRRPLGALTARYTEALALESRDLLQDLLGLDDQTRVETARDGFFSLRLVGGVGLRLYYYPYPLIDPEDSFGGLAVASPADLGLMKLGAIISRGTRRDFVDLYLLCREVPLAELLARSSQKFGHVEDFPLQALKGLADLSQISDEPLPKLEQPLDWNEVESWLHHEVRSLGRRQVGLS